MTEIKKPKLIVFDLGALYFVALLHPFWVDTHVTPPFRKTSANKIVDSNGTHVKCYKEVPEVLKKLHEDGYQLAVASRTSEQKGAEELIELFGWNDYFSYKEIYPGCKVTHFKKFKKQTELDFSSMLFFDDELRNITDLRKIDVTSILVKNGVTNEIVEQGLKEFAQQQSLNQRPSFK